MKIALVIDDALDRPDGVQQVVLSLGRWLAGRGHEVHYLCSGAGPEGLANVHVLASNVAVRFNGNRLRIPRPTSRRMLREFLAEQRFDVIHVQTPHSPWFGARVVDEARRVQGGDVRAVATFVILPHTRLAALATRGLGLMLRRNLARFDAFAALSAPASDFAKRAFGVAAPVIGSGIHLANVAAAVHTPRPPASADRPLRVVFLGRLVERKGVLCLIDAVAAMDPAARERIRVAIGGRGPLAGEAARRIAKRGLGDVVSLAGFVSEDDKPQFLADADIAVFPATGGESFGVVLVEAMAAGAGVVLGGDNAGYRSVLGDRPEVTVNPRDTRAFAAALDRLVRDGSLRDELRAAQAARVLDFDDAVVGARIEALYGMDAAR